VGGWYYILGEGKNIDEKKKNCLWKCQGEYKSYLNLTSEKSTDIWAKIVTWIDGEDVDTVGEEEVDEAAVAESEALPAEEQEQEQIPVAA
jgi:hypothetical protein